MEGRISEIIHRTKNDIVEDLAMCAWTEKNAQCLFFNMGRARVIRELMVLLEDE